MKAWKNEGQKEVLTCGPWSPWWPFGPLFPMTPTVPFLPTTPSAPLKPCWTKSEEKEAITIKTDHYSIEMHDPSWATTKTPEWGAYWLQCFPSNSKAAMRQGCNSESFLLFQLQSKMGGGSLLMKQHRYVRFCFSEELANKAAQRLGTNTPCDGSLWSNNCRAIASALTCTPWAPGSPIVPAIPFKPWRIQPCTCI